MFPNLKQASEWIVAQQTVYVLVVNCRIIHLGSILSNDSLLNKEILARIRKAICSFGHLYGRVWNKRGIKTNVNKGQGLSRFIIIANLYSCETWVFYRRHIMEPESSICDTYGSNGETWFRTLMFWREQWPPNSEAFLIKAYLRWTGHVLRMGDGRLPKDLLCRELWRGSGRVVGEGGRGSRSIGRRRKRLKETLMRSLTVCKIDIDKWQSTAQDRAQWRSSLQDSANAFEHERIATAQWKGK